jgi:predicted nucleic-acid-binding protein
VLSVDTNVLVRFLVKDHPSQSERAGELIHHNRIWIAKTVLLETEWILRSTYAYSPDRVLAAFRGLTGLPQVEVEGELEVAEAMRWFAAGMDFADALHLASSEGAEEFATFDRKFAAKAAKLTSTKVLTLH